MPIASIAKPKKTANELAELIAAEIPLGGIRLDIHPDPTGWNAVAYGSDPDRVARIQSLLGEIVHPYKLLYDLDVSS